jgi:hypothetical protein
MGMLFRQLLPLLDDRSEKVVLFRIEFPRSNVCRFHSYLNPWRNKSERLYNLRALLPQQFRSRQIRTCIPDWLLRCQWVYSNVCVSGIAL